LGVPASIAAPRNNGNQQGDSEGEQGEED